MDRRLSDGDPLRIGVLSVHTSPLRRPGSGDAGGLNVYALESARRLARRGHDVRIFTADNGDAFADGVEIEPGLRAWHIGHVPADAAKDAYIDDIYDITADLERRPEFADLDVVHSHYWLSGWAAVEAKARHTAHLCTMHTMSLVKSRDAGDGLDRPERAEAERALAQSTALVVNTRAEAVDAADLYGADPSRSYVIPPGVDAATFAPGDQTAARRTLDLPDDALMVMFAGRIQPLKGCDVLVDAIGRLCAARPDLAGRLQLAIIGGGSARSMADLDAAIDAAGIADITRMHDPVSRGDLAELFRAADVVAVPSRSESFGLVAAEAGSCGVPVVASAVGGLPDIVADRSTGVLVPPGDAAALAAALEALLDDAPLRAQLGAAASERMRNFTWDRTADGLLTAYETEIAALEGISR